ncbi:MAG: hypothetical protein GF320_18715 [Armatimonadia bacterium]|nr:hypothetical protein [Armatimonadia bacterium]
MQKAPWILILLAVFVIAALTTTGCQEWYNPGQPPEGSSAVTPPRRPPTPQPQDEEEPADEGERTVADADGAEDDAEATADEDEAVDDEEPGEGDESVEGEDTDTGEGDTAAEDDPAAEASTEDDEADEPDAATSSTTATAQDEEVDEAVEEPASDVEPEEDEPRATQAAPTRDSGEITLTQVVNANIEQAAVDCRVVRSHIESAQLLLTEQEASRARVVIQGAIRSAAFVRAGLPSVQAEQCLERAVQETERGRNGAAIAATEAAVNVSANITLRGTVAEFRRRGTQAMEHIEDGDLERARDILGRMQDMIVPSESEYTASRISDHLMGALSALDRDALRVAAAELTEADEKAFSLTRILEGVE